METMETICEKCQEYEMEYNNTAHCKLDDGVTPLMKAAKWGHSACLKCLVHTGADVNRTGTGRFTALMYAAMRGGAESVQVLIEAGADVNKADVGGETALMRAAICGCNKRLGRLLAAGADVNTQNIVGYTSLILAAQNGHSKCVEMLLGKGADVNIVNMSGNTALSAAAVQNRLQCVLIIVKAGANVNMHNMNLHNALQYYIVQSEYIIKDMCLLLYAAGEKIEGNVVEKRNFFGNVKYVKVPEYLLFEDLKLSLSHLCRQAIRTHLIQLDPHKHLFLRIPQLGLPTGVAEYLLYDVSLEEEDVTETSGTDLSEPRLPQNFILY